MLNSTVLEVAIGLVFCFASISAVTSALYEAGASFFSFRAKTLLGAVKQLLNQDQSLILGVYNHALVNPRSDGKVKTGDPTIKPSYIDPKNFAQALIDTVESLADGGRDLEAGIAKIVDPQLSRLLGGIYARAGKDVATVRAHLADWFEDAMDRVSGVYKRWSQFWTFLIAFFVAAALNVDAFHLFKSLWAHPALVAHHGVIKGEDASALLAELRELPIGWNPTSAGAANGGASSPDLSEKVLMGVFIAAGWVTTALSALFGAPFWFDLLQRIVNLRGTGQKPGQ